MTPFAIGLSGIALMLVMLFLRQPVWLALAVLGVGGNILLNSVASAKFMAGTTVFDVASNYNLSVIPLFILMGEIATRSRMSAELFNAARVLLSGLRGGLGVATLAASGAFGAICGSSVATAASMTRIAMPEMERAGYKRGYSAATVASGGSLGILIPPSIILVIYGSITETSVARLFAASMIPGLLLLGLYIFVALVVANRGGAPVETAATFLQRIKALKDPWQFALLFVLTIGGIYAGLFSPTEAASVGAFGAIVLGFLRGSLDMTGLFAAIRSSVLVSCALFMIIIGATLFANFVVQTRLPDNLLGVAEAAGLSAWMVMGLIIVIYIILGCFLEGIGMVLITVPVFLPIVAQYGYDPIWFGVLVVVLVELGLITPPVGMNLFIIRAQVPDVPMKTLYGAILPFLVAPVILIALLFVLPGVALWLPQILY